MEQENFKLKRLVAEMSLDKLVLKDVASGNLLIPDRRRCAVSRACKEHGVVSDECSNWWISHVAHSAISRHSGEMRNN